MQIVHRISECRRAVAAARARGERVGFFPTMGALHDGHAGSIERAAAECEYVVVSVFVNPLQFGPTEDYARYPRTLSADAGLCERAGAALVFAPSAEEMYPEPCRSFVNVEGVSDGLCGRSRPGHFRGVATVVSKLFHIVQPDAAFFSEKDAQQLAVIQRMASDLNFPIEIVPVPTVREADGLAMSSRNVYLTPDERAQAPVLHAALAAAAAQVAAGERRVAVVRGQIVRTIMSKPAARIDYVELVDARSFAPVDEIAGPVRAAVAVYFGSTRLIDNRLLAPGETV